MAAMLRLASRFALASSRALPALRAFTCSTPFPGDLVECTWLAENLDNVKILDGSWHMASSPRHAHREFSSLRIPGAQFFDIDTVVDPASPFPHTLPCPEDFKEHIEAIGISDGDPVVVYDTLGLFSAARVWFMLKVFGVKNAGVLQGGLPEWLRRDLPTILKPPTPPPKGDFSPIFNGNKVRVLGEIFANLKQQRFLVVDARSKNRFLGIDPEPRPGMRCGHIPGSVNLPMDALLDATGKMLPPPELKKVFNEAGLLLDPSQHIVCSCGSGVTACVVALGLDQVGHHDWSLFDGSWSEYCSSSGPIAKQ